MGYIGMENRPEWGQELREIFISRDTHTHTQKKTERRKFRERQKQGESEVQIKKGIETGRKKWRGN